MAYCLSCGRNRKVERCGFCAECLADEYKRREPDRRVEHARLLRKISSEDMAVQDGRLSFCRKP